MSSGNKYEVDPYNAGYDQPPVHSQRQPPGYSYPMSRSAANIVVNSASTPRVVAAQRESDWLVPAVFACLFCCWPVGVCAINAAVNARSRYDEGDYENGRDYSRSAKQLTLISLVLGVLCLTAVIIFQVFRVKELMNERTGTTTTGNPFGI
ncbi:trafficking regulator of GLUT4 1-like isoform X3 [Saccostrea cucullata]|uniref:trafficking regulator of GLUT4 1-like isoform X2 n=1 Tax=Saccostrea cuccullata TaxID=36930 RepID=UPI002ED1323D